MNPLHRRLPQLTTIAAAVGLVTGAQAFQIETDDPDLKVRLDTTVKLSAAARVAQRSEG
ncbi:MAG: hypothetical protein IPG57_09700 [Burkholderiales bacterium]|jgi:hypothetical protein|nr:hypothetical protein [Burkholderiales bacterium]